MRPDPLAQRHAADPAAILPESDPDLIANDFVEQSS